MAIYSDPLAGASGNFLLTLVKLAAKAVAILPSWSQVFAKPSGNFAEATGRFLLRCVSRMKVGFSRMSDDSKLFECASFSIATSFS